MQRTEPKTAHAQSLGSPIMQICNVVKLVFSLHGPSNETHGQALMKQARLTGNCSVDAGADWAMADQQQQIDGVRKKVLPGAGFISSPAPDMEDGSGSYPAAPARLFVPRSPFRG